MTAFTALRDTGRNLDETASKFGGFVSRRPWCRMTQRHQRTWHNESANREAPNGNQIPNRRRLTITRMVRSTAVGEWVKRLHDFTCQVCGARLVTMAGPYAEICHIKPLGCYCWVRKAVRSLIMASFLIIDFSWN